MIFFAATALYQLEQGNIESGSPATEEDADGTSAVHLRCGRDNLEYNFLYTIKLNRFLRSVRLHLTAVEMTVWGGKLCFCHIWMHVLHLMQPSKVRKTPQKQRQRSKIKGAKYF